MNYNTSLFQTLVLTAFVFKLFLKTTAQVLSCECCENFKNTYFEEHLRTAAFEMEYKITRCSLASPSILLQFNKEKPRKNFFFNHFIKRSSVNNFHMLSTWFVF